MFDIAGQPLLDKAGLIGGCVRLPLKIEPDRLRDEVAGLPDSVWDTPGGRVGVHNVAKSLFLRGFAPAEGEKPVQDRAALSLLPYARFIIEQLVPATALRCLLARLPAGAAIAAHVDRAPYFAKTLRVHVPIETNASVHMMAGSRCYSMRPGEIWVLNNSALHAVWNAHATDSRIHMICDFLPSATLLELLRLGERDLGMYRAEVEAHLNAVSSNTIAANT